MMGTLFIFLVLAIATSPTANAVAMKDVFDLETTCKTVAEAHRGIPSAYCTSALSPVAANHRVSLSSLAVAAAGLAIARADATRANIYDSSDPDADEPSKKRTGACQDAFAAAGDRLREAVAAINRREYPKAPAILRSSYGAFARCTDAYVGAPGFNPPVYDTDVEYERLAKLAEALVDMVLKEDTFVVDD